MKTQKLPQNYLDLKKARCVKSTHFNSLIVMSFVFMMTLSNSILAQSISDESIIVTGLENPIIETVKEYVQIKGIVSDKEGPLPGVTILLKGTTIGTSSNSKGEFTFPRNLNSGDILMFSYIGYKTKEVTIKENTSFIKMTMEEEDINIFESLQTNKPYKTKRKSL
ncbi:hypothetical protein D7030_01550 [Flavobacteriaceae bacterium AU392]|nr:hypothetical protein D1817_08005 [Flavobacteriaceae bacterium]RKM86562.1 hypothetical protein D7030_01550 [Flavobacteriaceae bacterium AU392]